MNITKPTAWLIGVIVVLIVIIISGAEIRIEIGGDDSDETALVTQTHAGETSGNGLC